MEVARPTLQAPSGRNLKPEEGHVAEHQISDVDELWKPVRGWPEFEVSNLGRVRRVATGFIRKPSSISGYQAMRLTRPGGHSQTILVHRAVAMAFLPRRRRKTMQVNHKDSDRWNPRADNLEWVTCAQNIQHGYDHGNCCAKGSRNGHSKINEAIVFEIRNASKDEYPVIAAFCGISMATVRDVVARRTWRHV